MKNAIKAKLLNISVFLTVLIVLLGVLEISMRAMGYRPGDISPGWLEFRPVDSLRVDNYFYTNKEGILIADSAFWAGEHIWINEDGFRSPAFTSIDSTKKKVMFIGDSFAWGKSASPLVGNCFVDLVRKETAYEVINLGIPAADPAQYCALAQKYIPLLKPDVVFVMFFMGNDLMTVDRVVQPGRPFCYSTNAGMIFADMDGKFFPTAGDAYNYLINERYYLKHPSGFFVRLISKSALLSRLYSIKFRIKEKLEYERAVNESSITKKYLAEIASVARQNGAAVRFVLIPELKEANMDLAKYKKRYNSLLNDSLLSTYWLVLKNSKKNFTPYPDGHLNNAGHRYYADSLEALIHKLIRDE